MTPISSSLGSRPTRSPVLMQPVADRVPAPDERHWPGLAAAPVAAAKASIARSIVRRAVNRLPVRMTFPDGTIWGGGSDRAPELREINARRAGAAAGAAPVRHKPR